MLCTCDTGLDLDDLDMFDADEYVPEVSQYTLVYKLGMPNKVDFRYKDYYSESPSVETEFTLIAYYVQLIEYQQVVQWVWVSMDAFTDEISKISFPSGKSGAIFQQSVYNLTIASNIKSVYGYYGTGNIEFWLQNY